MKLFGLKNKQTHAFVSNLYFREKKEAKTARDEHNKTEPGLYVVSLGPDHDKFKKQ